MELIKLGDKTYYIKNVNNIGVFKINDEEVYLIDSGNDKDAGKKILKLLELESLKVVGIISTHSHADHIGGNKVIKDRTNANIYAHGMELAVVNYPIFEPMMLYGSNPFSELQNKFLMAKGSEAIELENNLPIGLEYFNLKGHSLDMIGLKTSDDIYFLADSLASSETILKYHIFYLYDVEEYLNTLEFLKNLKGKYYILAHSEITKDISSLIDLNKKKIEEIIDVILTSLESPKTFEELLTEIFNHYNLVLNLNQYFLVGSTIKAYLTYLLKLNKINYIFQDNKMLWEKIV